MGLHSAAAPRRQLGRAARSMAVRVGKRSAAIGDRQRGAGAALRAGRLARSLRDGGQLTDSC